MSWIIIGVLIVLTFLFGSRILISVLVAGFIGWLLCDIDVEKSYTWYSGIWHGIFFLPNYIRYAVWDTPFKAEDYTTAYNILYWIFSILSSVSFLFGGKHTRQYD